MYSLSFIFYVIGFKWLANRSIELRNSGMVVLFSYEEALGFCVGDLVNDKDGETTLIVMLTAISATISYDYFDTAVYCCNNIYIL